MGKLHSGDNDRARTVISGTFGSTAASASAPIHLYYNLTLSGTFTATISIQRSFDAGSTWHTLARDAAGTAASYTAGGSWIAFEPEPGVLYRLDCTYTNGTVTYRLSQ